LSIYILGINAFHPDSSAVILKDGKLIAAVEEERLNREKHYSGFPVESIKFCLHSANISIESLDYIAINQDINSNIVRKILAFILYFTKFSQLFNKFKIKNNKKKSIKVLLENAFPGKFFDGEICYVEHHVSHLASAFLVSPFEEASIVSVDGFGDFASTAIGKGNNCSIDVNSKIYFPHSLGIFYQAITQFLGFKNFGDEYKVMGLAPYGKPIYLNELKKLLVINKNGGFKLNLQYFTHQFFKYDINNIGNKNDDNVLYSNKLIRLLGEPRKKEEEILQKHMDIAHSVQALYEEAFFNLLNFVYTKHGLDNITLAGGCAANSVANGKILNKTRFKKVYVQSAAGDAGGALGAAFYLWCSKYKSRNFIMNHSKWGPEYDNIYIKKLLLSKQSTFDQELINLKFVIDLEELCEITAKSIADGCIIGWFQGRMEWGPRALGSRSILADPRNPNIKEILNNKIKRRESFRPFAPSILRDFVNEWFEEEDDVPFMMQVFKIKENKRLLIPAVTHIDGTGRLQTVTKITDPLYYCLISKFKDITDIPMLVNTSFNENEPVVCSPEQALDCFLRTKMDVLVIGNWFLTRYNL